MKKEYLVERRPDRAPTHPGRILKEDVLPNLGLSVSAAAKELGITRQTLHRILNGSQSISPSMALRLGRFCNNSPIMWLRMQQTYDLWEAELNLADEIKKIPVHHAVIH